MWATGYARTAVEQDPDPPPADASVRPRHGARPRGHGQRHLPARGRRAALVGRPEPRRAGNRGRLARAGGEPAARIETSAKARRSRRSSSPTGRRSTRRRRRSRRFSGPVRCGTSSRDTGCGRARRSAGFAASGACSRRLCWSTTGARCSSSAARSRPARRRCTGSRVSSCSSLRRCCCSRSSAATAWRRPRCGRSRRCDDEPRPSARRRRGALPVPPARDEIAALAVTLNEMLARLEAAFEHERRFVADASHELRTPLALLRGELELALRRPRSREELEDAVRIGRRGDRAAVASRRGPVADRPRGPRCRCRSGMKQSR